TVIRLHRVAVDALLVQGRAELLHRFHGALRQVVTYGGVHDGIADDRVALLNGIAVDRGPSHAAGKYRDLLHPPERFLGPRDGVFGLLIDGRNILLVRDHDVAVHEPQEVFGVGTDIHILVTVYPDAAQHQHPGLFAADVLQHLLESLAVEQGRLDVLALGLCNFAG